MLVGGTGKISKADTAKSGTGGATALSLREKYLDELAGILQELARDRQELKEFLKDILTPAELAEIPKRWQIVKLLDRSVPHQEIADTLHTGIATVTRGARELRYKPGGFNIALKKRKTSSHA